MGSFTTKNGNFYLNGKKFNVYSGAIHYFRIHPCDWEDRLAKLKAAGFNTVETYAAWNAHQPTKDAFVFDGMYDLEKFIRLAQKTGLYVIFRPGPYICAEWDFGGFPAWLLAEKDMALRCDSQPYMSYCKKYLKEIFRRIKPYLITNGGNIIMMQVENEYGSYGNDKKYLKSLRDFYLENGIDVLLITSDGDCDNMLAAGTVEGCLPTLNFGSGAAEHYRNFRERYGAETPFLCTEFWGGWFDHWGEKHHIRPKVELQKEIEDFLRLDANFNFYMFCGGTNFGFTAGSNCTDLLAPTTTSYDYCALLNERGDYTENYFMVRELLCRHQNLHPPLPPVQSTGGFRRVALPEKAGLYENKKRIGYRFVRTDACSLEECGFSHGLIEYVTRLPGKYDEGSVLRVEGIADRAYIYVNGILEKVFDRTREPGNCASIQLNNVVDAEIKVLVDCFGHINYGQKIGERKGIAAMFIGQQKLFNYEIVCYPLDNTENLIFGDEASYPVFLKGTFSLQEIKDFYVKTDSFTKGMVWINGFNLGRFWASGPQKCLYVPKWILKSTNEIVVLELEYAANNFIDLCDQQYWND